MEQKSQLFLPERNPGIVLHGIIASLLIILMLASLWSATTWAEGTIFILFMMLIVILTGLIPFVLYRGYALHHARYIVERDGLRLRWGLRTEDIPLGEIEWVRRANESGFSITPPIVSWPGALLGERVNEDLGKVEFLASDLKKLILVATYQKTFAISPQNPREFENAFQRSFEMGSLFPIESQSTRPAAFIQMVLKDKYAKYLLPMNFGLTLLLWLISGFIIVNYPQLPLGFSPQGFPLERVPSQQLLLLPILGLFVMVQNLILGLFYFRKEETFQISYLLWIGGVFTPFLLLISMIVLSINA